MKCCGQECKEFELDGKPYFICLNCNWEGFEYEALRKMHEQESTS